VTALSLCDGFFSPPGNVRGRGELQLLPLQSCAEGARCLLLYSEVASPLWAEQLERKLRFWLCWFKMLWVFKSWIFWENMRGMQIADITLTSLAIFHHCFQSKKQNLHCAGMWACQVWSLAFLFAYQSQNAFPALVLLCTCCYRETKGCALLLVYKCAQKLGFFPLP
jgi:hypothetical protein